MRYPVLKVVVIAYVSALPATSAPPASKALSFRDQAALRHHDLQPDEPIIKVLKRFEGERVMIPLIHLDGWDDRPVAPAPKLLGRLQNFCEAFTPKDKGDQPDMIPFGVRGTWVVAPATQLAINYDYRFVDPRAARSRSSAVRDAVLGIPAALLPQVGTDSGMPIASLPTDVQESLLLALHPPFSVSQRRPSGEWNPPDAPKPIAFSERLDLGVLRFRMRLRSGPPMLRSSNGRSYSGSGLPWPADTKPWLEIEPSVRAGSFNLQVVSQVPNKYKPTDLDGAKLTQPLGIHGLLYVAAILQRVERVTGVKLHAKDSWESGLVFVGTDAVTCGEALDGLRLIFTGAWRKVGGLYYLSWNREGIRNAQHRWLKAASPVMDAVKAAEPDAYIDERWGLIARQTPFASDDPMRWSDEQRQALFGEWPYDEKNPFPERPSFFYPQMSPEQQAAIRGILLPVQSSTPPKQSGVPPARPLTQDELSRVALTGSATLIVEVSLPDAGWVRIDFGFPNTIDASRLDNAQFSRRVRADMASHPPTKPTARYQVNPWGFSASVPEAKEKAVLLPALAPARMPAVAVALKQLGVSTLVYPLLYGGYTTLPGLAFPLDPALNGANGWTAAVKAAKANGLQILGSVNVLEWRAPGRTGHWLDADPSWLDIDDAGRTRSQWFASLGETSLDYRLGAAIGGDLVRVAMPDVQTRLEALVDGAAKTLGADGIVFDKWDESPNVYVGNDIRVPQLGFSEPDRVAMILQQGKDPADEPVPAVSFPIDWSGLPTEGEPINIGVRSRTTYSVGGTAVQQLPRNPAEIASDMMDVLVMRTRKAATGWKIWVVKEGDDQRRLYGSSQNGPKMPAGDALLFTKAESGIRPTASVLIRVPANHSVEADPQVPAEAKQWPALGVVVSEMYRMPLMPQDSGTIERLVYDFRAATDDPVASLKWLDENGALGAKARAAYYEKMRNARPPVAH